MINKYNLILVIAMVTGRLFDLMCLLWSIYMLRYFIFTPGTGEPQNTADV